MCFLFVKVIQEGLQDNLLMQPSDFLQNYLLMYYIANGLKTVTASNVFLVSENFETNIEKINSNVLTKILWWSEVFSKDNSPGFRSFCSSLRLHIIRRARKEKNFNLATLHVNKFLNQEELFKEEMQEQFSLDSVGNLLLQKKTEMSSCSLDVARAVKEVIKLLYATEDNKQLVFNLCAAASTGKKTRY